MLSFTFELFLEISFRYLSLSYGVFCKVGVVWLYQSRVNVWNLIEQSWNEMNENSMKILSDRSGSFNYLVYRLFLVPNREGIFREQFRFCFLNGPDLSLQNWKSKIVKILFAVCRLFCGVDHALFVLSFGVWSFGLLPFTRLFAEGV